MKNISVKWYVITVLSIFFFIQLSGVASAQAGNLVFWNKLGSVQEVQNSEVGSPMVIYGNPTFETGVFGNAVTIDHFSEYIITDLWNPGEKKWGQDEFTFEFWCKINGHGWLGMLFDFIKGGPIDWGYLRLCMDKTDTGLMRFEWLDYPWLGGAVWVPLPNGYDYGNWHHYAVAVTISNAYFYYDGELMATLQIGDMVINKDVPYQLSLGSEGTYHMTNFEFFGTIDNWKVWDYAKTDFSDRFFESGEIPVDIDIKPGSYPNCFNINGHGVIPVAVLGSEEFDVNKVDPSTLNFAGLAVRVRGNKGALCHLDDVSGDFTNPEGAPDGYLDLVCQFEDDATAWMPGDNNAVLTGALYDGIPIRGEDSICVQPE